MTPPLAKPRDFGLYSSISFSPGMTFAALFQSPTIPLLKTVSIRNLTGSFNLPFSSAHLSPIDLTAVLKVSIAFVLRSLNVSRTLFRRSRAVFTTLSLRDETREVTEFAIPLTLLVADRRRLEKKPTTLSRRL